MIDRFFATIRTVGDGWRADAAARAKVWPEDPAARALAFCAGELDAVLGQLRRDTVTISVSEFAKAHGCREQTVRGWIRAGKLDAVKGPQGWEIPASARPRRLHLHRSSVAA